jgi:hypothetical protein
MNDRNRMPTAHSGTFVWLNTGATDLLAKESEFGQCQNTAKLKLIKN